MASYSVATTKDQLSRLIDKALAGEEVVITRHGKPTVELRVVAPLDQASIERTAAFEQLRKVRETLPFMPVSYLELKRAEEEERPF